MVPATGGAVLLFLSREGCLGSDEGAYAAEDATPEFVSVVRSTF